MEETVGSGGDGGGEGLKEETVGCGGDGGGEGYHGHLPGPPRPPCAPLAAGPIMPTVRTVSSGDDRARAAPGSTPTRLGCCVLPGDGAAFGPHSVLK